MNRIDRRNFLRHTTMMTALGTSGAWLSNLAAVQKASAQSTTTSDYRALVCIFLAGGNDGHNTVIPTDAVSWRCYSATRDPKVMAALNGITAPDSSISLALDQASLLKINHLNAKSLNTGRTFGLHPQLKKIQALYAASQAAIVANVGPLIQPTTKADLIDLSFELPRNLFSHNDQTSTWQSFGPEGVTGGWGGLLMDKLASRNVNKTFGSIGVGSNAVWLNGQQTMPYLLGKTGFQVMGGRTGQLYGSAALYQAARKAATTSSRTDILVADYLRTANRAVDSESSLIQSMPDQQLTPWGTPALASGAVDPLLQYTDPTTGLTGVNPLAQQLQTVARMIAARNNSAIGAHRQVFMVTLPGFDTHSGQMPTHASLLAKLDQAVDFFQKCLSQMPGGDVRSQVTTFTASEFGRSLVSNGDGTDHGWGSHHFVFGGAVKGGDVYGKFPQFGAFDGDGNFFSDQLLDQGGCLLPGLSVDQLVYTLGKWMGASEADLVGATPGTGLAKNIANFDATLRDIGFMA